MSPYFSPVLVARGVCVFSPRQVTVDLQRFAQMPQPLFDPVGLGIEPVSSVEAAEFAVALKDVKADVPLEFSEILGAEVEGTGVAFDKTVRTVHDAGVLDTVVDAEGVCGLVGQDLEAAAQDEEWIVLRVGSEGRHPTRITARRLVMIARKL